MKRVTDQKLYEAICTVGGRDEMYCLSWGGYRSHRGTGGAEDRVRYRVRTDPDSHVSHVWRKVLGPSDAPLFGGARPEAQGRQGRAPCCGEGDAVWLSQGPGVLGRVFYGA